MLAARALVQSSTRLLETVAAELVDDARRGRRGPRIAGDRSDADDEVLTVALERQDALGQFRHLDQALDRGLTRSGRRGPAGGRGLGRGRR